MVQLVKKGQTPSQTNRLTGSTLLHTYTQHSGVVTKSLTCTYSYSLPCFQQKESIPFLFMHKQRYEYNYGHMLACKMHNTCRLNLWERLHVNHVSLYMAKPVYTVMLVHTFSFIRSFVSMASRMNRCTCSAPARSFLLCSASEFSSSHLHTHTHIQIRRQYLF